MSWKNCRFAICDLRLPSVIGLLAIMTAGGCSSLDVMPRPTTRPGIVPATAAHGQADPDWNVVAETLGTPGVLKDGVYLVTVPRDDLNVRIEGMDVPAAAGIASTFYFYKCSCGKTVVIGNFIVADYEANDVVYALQKLNILVSSIGPYLLYDNPRLTCVRCQAEGHPHELAEGIKSALQWTARNRKP